MSEENVLIPKARYEAMLKRLAEKPNDASNSTSSGEGDPGAGRARDDIMEENAMLNPPQFEVVVGNDFVTRKARRKPKSSRKVRKASTGKPKSGHKVRKVSTGKWIKLLKR